MSLMRFSNQMPTLFDRFSENDLFDWSNRNYSATVHNDKISARYDGGILTISIQTWMRLSPNQPKRLKFYKRT